MLELARGAGLTVRIDWPAVPLLPGVRELAARGIITGASGRNWAACAPEALDAVRAVFQRHGFGQTAVIGQMLPRGERALAVRVD